MERRVFIAIVLSFLVLYMYQAYFAPPPAAPAKPAASTASQTQASTAASGTGAAPATTEAPADAAPQPAAAPEPQALVSETSEREITVDTSTVQAVFTNRGGRLLHWRLKAYRDNSGHSVDLVPSGLPGTEPLPFSLRVDQPDLTARLNNAIYRAGGDASGHVDATHGAASVSFEFQDVAGLHVVKQFRFDPANYIVALTISAANGDSTINPSVVWGPGPGDITPSAANPGFFNRSAALPPELILHRAGKVERVAITKISEQPIQEGQFRFAGVDDHYFMIAAINPGQVRIESRALVVPGPAEARRQLISHAIRFPQPPSNARFFVGPKQFDLLRSIDTELTRAVNFNAWFGWLAVPLLGALKWLHGIVGNWGWSIVLLTVLINLAMFPLRHKSVVSMRRMQELQPQLKAIQDRYANLKVTDPAKQKMNTEVMNLYREKGVNPASGCVPMLLMMPVLFAFYSLLSQAIELRGAEFWWIKDLSQADPYFVIPVLVSVTMFLQQKMSPATADPTQQRMMMFMPIMFGFIFLTTAAGTALYWFVSNVWGIGQQYFTNWMIGPPAVHAVRPAAERRIKNAGTGRTAGAEKHS